MKHIIFHINEKRQELLVNGHETLAAVIRDKIGLTGTKTGCEQGSCGACTVLLNDKPVLSCITPVLRCNRKSITTIEGLAQNGKLHLLQNKFIEKGALQCGYCTPGMILTALCHVKENPSASVPEIKEALSGNLCRCTGYKKIIQAVAEYAQEISSPRPLFKTNSREPLKTKKSEANEPEKAELPIGNEHFEGEVQRRNSKFLEVPSQKNGHIIGKAQPYIESEKKVQGLADYADDIKVKNALQCKFLRSPHAHAVIEEIDISDAVKIPGVRAIATGKELPGKFGVLPVSQDETAMAIDKVRYIGEIVAAVAADSENIAAEACKHIKVKYSPLRPFFEMRESLKEIKPEEKIHSHTKKNNNIHKIAELRFGKQKAELERAEVKSSITVKFEGLNHAFTEPHAATAYWDENGLTLISATQVPHYVHRTIAKVMEIPLSRVRIIKPYLGGGFGGKSDPFAHEIIIAHLSRKTGKPVHVRLSREEVFITNHGRHPSEITISAGADKNGILKVLDADIVIDGGAYGSFGVVTSYYNGVLLQAPYKVDNFGFCSKRVYTNKPQCGAMRGHGAVNPRFVMEVTLDDLAHKLSIDPCDLRMKNFFPKNTFTIGQFRITSNGSEQCLNTVRKQSGWNNRYGKLPFGHGLGVACGFFISGSALPIIWNDYPQSVVHLKVDFDGRVLVASGASDIGQGSDTVLAMIVAESLGLPLKKIFILAADTLLTPVDLGSYSSRVTFMAGNAAIMAAENLKKEIFSAIAKRKNIPVEELNLSDGKFFSNDKSIDLNWEEGIDIATARRGALTVSGHYNSPKLGGEFKGAGAGLSPSYSFGAVVAEVKVDTETGQVKVLNLWGAHDCGKALNPLAVEGQLEGSWHMGLGQALGEQMKYYNGLILNSNFIDYSIPTALDTPEMHTNIIESQDPEGPFGAKECGEGAIHPAIPSVANAIFDAVGVRVTCLPVSAEEILDKMKAAEKTPWLNNRI